VYDLGNQWTAYGSVTEIHKSQANMLAGPAPGAALDPIKGRSFELGMKGNSPMASSILRWPLPYRAQGAGGA
jgi:outer membrane receptor for ferric coprogen and ferric-rhodotorulic acid